MNSEVVKKSFPNRRTNPETYCPAILNRQKARKEYDCTKCEGKIKKGDEYYRFSLSRFHPLCPLCLNCKPTFDFLSTIYGIEDGSTIEDSVKELCLLIKERYEDFSMHPVCKACRRSRKEKKKCYQTTAIGLYRFDCLDKK